MISMELLSSVVALSSNNMEDDDDDLEDDLIDFRSFFLPYLSSDTLMSLVLMLVE